MNFEYHDTMVGSVDGPITACRIGSNSIAYCCSCYTLYTGQDTNCSFTYTTFTNIA